MTVGDNLREGSDTFLNNPALTVLGFIGAFVGAVIAFVLGSGSSMAPAGISGAIYLVYADILVSMIVVAAMLSLIDVVRTEADYSILRKSVYRLPSFIGATILAVFMIAGGIVMFVLPGIYVAVRLSLFPVYVVIEDESALTALGSSWDTVKGRFWYTFAILLTIGVVGVASLEVLSLLPATLIDEASMVHTTVFVPWSVAVVYHFYAGISTDD